LNVHLYLNNAVQVPVIGFHQLVSPTKLPSHSQASLVDLQPGNSAVAFSLNNPRTNGGVITYSYITVVHVYNYGQAPSFAPAPK